MSRIKIAPCDPFHPEVWSRDSNPHPAFPRS
jgi:hypothetical protein